MSGNKLIRCALAIVFGALASVVVADSGPVAAPTGLVATLTVQKVVTDPDGKEVLAPADEAKPGELLEYAAVYTNHAKFDLHDVLATVPIPTGTEYVEGHAKPRPVAASVDGKHFEPVPLKRVVKRTDGTEEVQLVPLAEYRALRWNIEHIEAGKAATVTARARLVNAAPGAPMQGVKNEK